MQAAKDAVRKITGKDGKHDTTVHEHVNPAITKETVHQNQEHRVTTALDKEVHQDHYHTSVQPVEDTKVLPEQHHHRMGEVEHRKFEHGNDHETKQRLADEAAQFKDSSVRTEGKTTHSVQPVAAGEHVHHHVHESIQPVVERQTVEPHVIHTTAPVHEVHHNAAKHHTASTLPAMTMDEFKSSGGQLGGRGERSDHFEGQPSAIGTSGTHGVGHSHTNGGSIGTSTGTHGVGHSHNTSTRDDITTGSHGHSGTTTGTGASSGAVTAAQTATGTSQPKPSLMDKINPAKDADHDGVKGFMK